MERSFLRRGARPRTRSSLAPTCPSASSASSGRCPACALVGEGAPGEPLGRLLRADEHLGVRLVVDESDLGHPVEHPLRDLGGAAPLAQLRLELARLRGAMLS